MRAMVLDTLRQPLRERDVPDPKPGPGQLRLAVLACAVCRTDLHVVDGELPDVPTPIVPGHEIVGVVAGIGPSVDPALAIAPGARLGVGWLGSTCGRCE